LIIKTGTPANIIGSVLFLIRLSLKSNSYRISAIVDETEKDFAYLIMVMSTYRNKFVAYLDEYNIAQIYPMDMAKDAVQFYHSYIVRNEANSGDLAGLLTDLDDYYSACYQEAEKIYGL
jgi:hypothetical protein